MPGNVNITQMKYLKKVGRRAAQTKGRIKIVDQNVNHFKKRKEVFEAAEKIAEKTFWMYLDTVVLKMHEV